MSAATWNPLPGGGGSGSTPTFRGTVSNQAGMLALGTAVRGDWCKRADTNTSWWLVGETPSALASWFETPKGLVWDSQSVQSGSTSTSSDIIKPDESIQYVNPSAESSGIFFAKFGQSVYGTTAKLTNGGHFVGVMGWSVLNANADVQLAIGVEGRYDHGSNVPQGRTRDAKPLLALLTSRSGVMDRVRMVATDLQNYAGSTITEAYGHHAEITINNGTIGKYVAFGMPNMTETIPGVGTKLFFENLDPQAPSTSLAPIVDQSYAYIQPASGFAYQIAKNVTDVQILAGGTLESGTVGLPAPAVAIDGMEICIGTTQTITAFTLSGQGSAVYGAPTTLEANTCVRYKFYGRGINIWVRR